MAVIMSDLKVKPKTHLHTCPLCGNPSICTVPFCEDLKQLICDDCPAPTRSNYEAVAKYMRERGEGRRV